MWLVVGKGVLSFLIFIVALLLIILVASVIILFNEWIKRKLKSRKILFKIVDTFFLIMSILFILLVFVGGIYCVCADIYKVLPF